MKNSDIQEALKMYELPVDMSLLDDELKVQLSNFIPENMSPEIVQLSKQSGDHLVHTPPHHSNLQPTEMLGALTKANIGV